MITETVDREIRERLAGLYGQARDVLDLSSTDADRGVWIVSRESPAWTDEPIVTRLFAYMAPEFAQDGGLNLPLTQARILLGDAASCLQAAGVLTLTDDTAVRFAALAPVARSATERAATVEWLL